MRNPGDENMIIEHIIGIFSKEHGGPTISISDYTLGQAALNHEVRLRVLEGYSNTSPAVRLDGIDQKIFPVAFPKKASRSPSLKSVLRHEEPPDIYHLHGVWPLPTKYGAYEARRRNVPYVVQMMGGYQPAELQRKPWRKMLFRRWYADRLLRNASCIHVNSRMEMDQMVDLGFKGPFAVIPVGFDTIAAERMHHRLGTWTPTAICEKWKAKRFVLFLARVHPNKGVDILLRAWSRIKDSFPNVHLLIAGPGDPDYKSHLRSQIGEPLSARVEFLDFVSEIEKTWLYKNAAVYCLPTFGENYGATIQDALGYGTPVVTTHCTPWTNLEEIGFGWIAAPDEVSLERKLRLSLELGREARDLMGENAKQWIRANFSLTEAIERQLAMYRWIRGDGRSPDFIFSR
jgi:glycosyltransferase involved in cell wall biosynthesis